MFWSFPAPTAKCRAVPLAATTSGKSSGPPEPKSTSPFDSETVFSGVSPPARASPKTTASRSSCRSCCWREIHWRSGSCHKQGAKCCRAASHKKGSIVASVRTSTPPVTFDARKVDLAAAVKEIWQKGHARRSRDYWTRFQRPKRSHHTQRPLRVRDNSEIESGAGARFDQTAQKRIAVIDLYELKSPGD